MANQPLHIGVDIDDVLYPWGATAHALCEAAGITNGKNYSRWEMHEDYGVSLETWLKVIDEGCLSGALYGADPISGALEGLQEIRDAGHQIHLVTARGFFKFGDIIRGHTVRWLFDHDVPHDSLHFIKDKTLLRMDVFLDDAPHNVTALERTGVETYLMDAQHNRSFEHLNRVNDFNDFNGYVLGHK